MNKAKIRFLFLWILFLGSACNQIMERIFNPPSKSSEFEYYDKNFQLEGTSGLNTESFYYTRGVGVSGAYFAYLKFYPDGALEYFGGTSLSPDSVDYYNLMKTERKKRSGIPKDRKANWGDYTTENDSIKLTFKKHRAMSSIMHKYLGVLNGHSITFKTYSYSALDSGYHYESDEIYEMYEY